MISNTNDPKKNKNIVIRERSEEKIMISASVLKNRCKSVQLAISKSNILLTTNSSDIFYLTNEKVSSGWMVLGRNTAVLGIDERYKIDSDVVEVVSASDLPALKDEDVHVAKGCLYEDIERIKDKTGNAGASWPKSDAMEQARMIKDSEEISRIKQAAKICKRVIRSLFDKVSDGIEGKTEKEIARYINSEMFNQGADGLAFDTIVAFGENSAIPHHSPGSKKYIKGDVILCDFGVSKNGYCVDVTRTFAFSEKAKDVAKIVMGVKQQCEEMVSNGESFASLSRRSHEMYGDLGLHTKKIHSLGHGIGVDVHEKPVMNDKSEDLVENGHVFTLEPGVYVDGEFGVRVEDTYLFDGGKLKNLTK